MRKLISLALASTALLSALAVANPAMAAKQQAGTNPTVTQLKAQGYTNITQTVINGVKVIYAGANLDIDAYVYRAAPVFFVKGVEYTQALGNAGMVAADPVTKSWVMNHVVYPLGHKGELGYSAVAVKPLQAAFWKKWVPTYYPNVNPAPVGVTRQEWAKAIQEAPHNHTLFTPTPNVNSKTAYSPLATKTQWFPDPKDPFFDKRFPLKDLKNGFVLSRRPFVNITLDSAGGVYVNQYVGYVPSAQQTLWLGESVNPKTGVVMNVGILANSALIDPYTKPQKGQGIVLASLQEFDTIWAAGSSALDVVPLMNWNPKDVVHIPYS